MSEWINCIKCGTLIENFTACTNPNCEDALPETRNQRIFSNEQERIITEHKKTNTDNYDSYWTH